MNPTFYQWLLGEVVAEATRQTNDDVDSTDLEAHARTVLDDFVREPPRVTDYLVALAARRVRAAASV